MKNSMITKLTNCAAAITAIALAAGLYSCSDDLPSEGNTPDVQQKLSFTVTTNDYLNNTRAVAPQFIGNMVSNNGGDPITVAEVIDNSITGDTPAPAADKATRGIPVENAEFPNTTGYNGFKLMAATYDNTTTWATAKAATVATNFIDKLNVLGENGFETQYIWPGTSAGKMVAFFAWAPYTNTEFNTSLTTSSPDLTVSNEQGTPQLTYTVPTDNVSKQFDLITATAVDVPGDHNNIQQLHFNHVLSCIKFAAGDLRDCKITDIKLTNIHYRGTYTFSDETDGMGTWQNTADTKTICIGHGETADVADVQDRVTGEERNFVLNAGDKNLMMLPQTLEQGAQLQVSFVFNSVDMNEKKTDADGNKLSTTNGTISRTYTIDLSGRVWESGKTYTYILSTNSVNSILLVERPKDFKFDGTTTDATFRVSSYKYVNGGQTEPLPWTVEYYEVESNGAMGAKIDKPSWIEETTDAATNTTGGYQAYEMKLVAQQMTATGGAVSAITALQNADPIGTEETPIDLSYRDVMGVESELQNTANCYVVRQPGWYTFPLVYGNGIKDGVVNGVALGSVVKLNAEGHTINNAYIYEDNSRGDESIGDAVIVWQDAPQLITPASVQLTSDKHGIKFQIEKRHITQGNAVIAVRDATDNHILWSWHIWVTAQDFSDESLVTVPTTNPSTTEGIQSATFMPVALGYCDGVRKEFQERSFFVEVIQTETGRTATFKVTQTGKTGEYIGANAPYYGWGTKDPKLASKGFLTQDKETYDKLTSWSHVNVRASIGDAIQNPMTFYNCSGTAVSTATENSWFDTHYSDLWCVGESHLTTSVPIYSSVVKTIYDPSPVGFTVPGSGAVTWFTNQTYTNQSENETTGAPKAYSVSVSETKSLLFPKWGYRGWHSGYVGTGFVASFGSSMMIMVAQRGSTYRDHTVLRADDNNNKFDISYGWNDYATDQVMAIKEE